MIINELKALANEKRLKIIYILTIRDFCQTHIAEIANLSQVDCSRNLKILIDAGLVIGDKRSNRVIYRLEQKFVDEYQPQVEKIKEQFSYLLYDIDIERIGVECDNLDD